MEFIFGNSINVLIRFPDKIGKNSTKRDDTMLSAVKINSFK